MSSDRRGFLRGLATLPLIGGGVTLIGRPTAVDVQPSTRLVETYLGWLRMEHTRVMHGLTDRWGPPGQGYHEHGPMFALPRSEVMAAAVRSASVTSHAAVVLSTVGIDWRAEDNDCDGLVNRHMPSWRDEYPTYDPFRTYPDAFRHKYGQEIQL